MNYERTATIRRIPDRDNAHVLVVRLRTVDYFHPCEHINFFPIKRPPDVVQKDLLGKPVVYDIVDKCYYLDPTEITWNHRQYRRNMEASFQIFLAHGEHTRPIKSFTRKIPRPKTQARINPEWRQGKWMKHLEHNREWKEC